MQYCHRIISSTIVHLYSNQPSMLLLVAVLVPDSLSTLSWSSRGIWFAPATGQLLIAM